MTNNVSTLLTNRIAQGDIIRDVEYIEAAIENSGVVEISKIIFPYVVVLTQECDLQWDFESRLEGSGTGSTQDKYLLSVIVAPLYNAEHVFAGNHLDKIGRTMVRKSSDQKKILKNNETPRYHYIEFPQNVTIVPSVVDFKHYFTVNVEYLMDHKRKNFVCSVNPIFREHLCQRFSNFLSRIGLPV